MYGLRIRRLGMRVRGRVPQKEFLVTGETGGDCHGFSKASDCNVYVNDAVSDFAFSKLRIYYYTVSGKCDAAGV